MTDNTSMLERLGDAIEKAANVRAYGLYDYSAYPEAEGGLKAHVVRDELTRGPNVVFESDSPREAREFYEAAVRRFIARAALQAIREPTEAMLNAGNDAPYGCSEGIGLDRLLEGPGPDDYSWQTGLSLVYQAMIDAILSEDPTNG